MPFGAAGKRGNAAEQGCTAVEAAHFYEQRAGICVAAPAQHGGDQLDLAMAYARLHQEAGFDAWLHLSTIGTR